MTWNLFSNVSQLNTPDLDTNYSNLAAKVSYPCTATGTNTIALTTAAGDPPVTAYTSRAPVFGFVAAGNSTGSVTVNVNGIGAKNLYKNNGFVQVGNGDLTSGGVYYVAFDATLNSAAGGFVLISNPANFPAITVQSFTSGVAQTYIPTAGTIRIRVRMVGGGGGGGAGTTNAGSNGG